MKTRKERFQKYRSSIKSMDDGDLPIAQSEGKHLKKGGYASIKHEDSSIEPKKSKKKNWTRSRIFVYSLVALILIFAILGVIMVIFG